MIDNVGAIHVVKNNAVTPNTKHIDIKTRYLQLEVQEERLEVEHVRTEECHANIETKNLLGAPLNSAFFGKMDLKLQKK